MVQQMRVRENRGMMKRVEMEVFLNIEQRRGKRFPGSRAGEVYKKGGGVTGLGFAAFPDSRAQEVYKKGDRVTGFELGGFPSRKVE
jgi:hypothetical protein